MRLGALILPDRRWAEAVERWRRAEELGFNSAWTYDHIAWRSLRDAPWFAAVPTLAAAATATSTLRIGTLVASPNFRHPVPFAREIVTLDDISSGRLTLGIGAGGEGWDATVLGQPAWSRSERMERFAEFVALLDQLLTDEETTHRGGHYAAVDAPMCPGCVQRPRVPFAIAASGPKGMAVAARFADIWVTNGDRDHDGALLGAEAGASLVREQAARFAAACETNGRDPSSIGRLVLTGLRLDAGLSSVDQFADTIGRYAEVGVTDLVVHWPRESPPFAGDVDRFERVIAAVTH